MGHTVLSTKWTLIGFGIAGGLIFSLYIVYDTQLMLGGKHKYALDPEEYVFAALSLYLDVINLFIYVLLGVGGANNGWTEQIYLLLSIPFMLVIITVVTDFILYEDVLLEVKDE